MILERPQSEESGSRYLSLVPQQGDLANIFVEQGNRVESFILGLSDEEAMHRYQPEKWSVKEVIGHLIDTERVCAYRLLCAARGDRTPMASFDEDAYVKAADYHHSALVNLAEEWKIARESTLSILKNLSASALYNQGTFKDRPQTALTVACVIVGHANHHLNILSERYGIDGR